MKRRTKVALITGALVVAGAIGGSAIAAVSGGTPDTGTGANDIAVPPGYTGINDPNLQACMAAKQVCNPSALPEIRTLPWAATPAVNATGMSRSDAEQLVRNAIGAPAMATIFSEQLTGSAAIAQLGIDRNSTTNESREVWVVTVLAAVTTDGSPATAPTTRGAYSAVVDESSGQITDDCIGCKWLSASQ
jgi:hypothetical protein